MHVLMLSKALVVGAYQRKLEEIAAQGVELTVAVPPSWKDERGEVKLERTHTRGYRLVTQPLWFNGNYHLHFYPWLDSLLRETKPEVFHIDEEPYNFATFHALALAQRYHLKTLFFSWQNLNRTYPFPFSFFERYVLQNINYAICGNQEAVKVWQGKGYHGRVRIIPQFGVDPQIFAWQAPRPTTSLVIAYAGRLVPEKGVELLLRAFACLPQQAQLKFLGAGPLRDSLAQLAQELNVANRVEFLAWQPSAEFPKFLRTVDVLVLPSLTQKNWKEQFGRVLIEAMACGVPVVGSTCGEIPQVIGEAGLIFNEGNETALVEALSRLNADESLRVELSQKGRARVLALFTQQSVAQQTVEVYEELLSNDSF